MQKQGVVRKRLQSRRRRIKQRMPLKAAATRATTKADKAKAEARRIRRLQQMRRGAV